MPLARVIAANPRLPFPFKRYAIAPVWRDGPLKTGRYREFCQADVDVVGASGALVEAELLALAVDAFKELEVEAILKVNNRKVLNGILAYAGVPKDGETGAILAIDKLAKIGVDGVRDELVTQRGVDASVAEKLLSLLGLGDEYPSAFDLLAELRSIEKTEEGLAGLRELKEFFDFCAAYNVLDKIKFEPWLARGLSYYTGTVFEAYLTDASSGITSSIAGGGRYDAMIGQFSGKERVPAVGFSFGIDVLTEYVKKKKPSTLSAVQAFVVPVNELAYAIDVAQKLRAAGVKCSLDVVDRSVSKNLEWASKQKIPYAVVVGAREREKNEVTLRDLRTGAEAQLRVADAVARINSTQEKDR